MSSARAAPILDEPLPRTSTASVDVESAVGDVYQALANPRAWPRVLRDIERVEPVGDAQGSWRVVSKLMGHAHVVEFTLEKDRLVHFRVLDPGPGGALVVDIRLEQLAPARTRVSYTMMMLLPLGLDGVFDDQLVRRQREKKVLGDLADIERRFGSKRPAAPAPAGAHEDKTP